MKELALEEFTKMDTDKSGKVSFEEFKKAMEKKVGTSMSSAALKKFFDSM